MSDCNCEAKKAGVCFGCEADYLDIVNNYFPYYKIKKECETLKKFREENNHE